MANLPSDATLKIEPALTDEALIFDSENNGPSGEPLTVRASIASILALDVEAESTFTSDDEIKLDGIEAGAEVNPQPVSQSEAEAGTSTDERSYTPQRVAQAIAALAPSASVADGAVTTVKLADTAVTTAKLANDAVTADKLAADAVVAANITADAVTTSKVQNNAISADKLAGAAVTAPAIASDAVTTAKIQDAAVTNAKLASSVLQNTTASYTTAEETKLSGIATSANNYVHPNHTGDVTSTADGATVIASGAVDIANLSATGTASSSTFLRGDNTWAAPAGAGDLLASNNLSDLANAVTARTNLGVAIGSDVQAHDSILDNTTASYTTAEETKLSGIATGAEVNPSVMSQSEAEGGTDTNARLVTAQRIAQAIAELSPVVAFVVDVVHETTDLTTGTAVRTFRMPYGFTLTGVRASVSTAPTGSSVIVDINESGSTILSTKLSIDATEKTSTTAASAAVISDASLADDAEITIDIDQIGSTIAGSGLKVTFLGNQA